MALYEKHQDSSAGNNDSKGMYLLKKGQNGVIRAVFSRVGICILLLALQVFLMFNIYISFEAYFFPFWVATRLMVPVMVIRLVNSRMDPTAKITWLLLIMLTPIFGTLLYWYTGRDLGHRVQKARLAERIAVTKGAIPQQKEVMDKLEAESPETASLVRYLQREGCFPVFGHTEVMYFPSGEAKFEQMLTQLRAAKEYIFVEYFIVEEGFMWGQILEILAEKAAAGVTVRVMYDGTCEFSKLSRDYPKRLEKLGIACKPFAPVTPFISTHYNNRDHRKILVIDGKIGFTGGVNLADEYINQKVRYGHWKDVAVMLRGEAVKSLTLMFLQMWDLEATNPDLKSFLKISAISEVSGNGYVIPYGVSPMNVSKVGQQVYMDLLNRAKKYVHIMTPYLILDSELECALCFAAERGVDVTMILPGISDSKAADALAKNHYAALIQSGVRIYEYSPGFVHAKVFVCDDEKAVVGTINLDYRSLYHHFECAVYLYKVSCIDEIEQDFQDTLKKSCQIAEREVRGQSGWLRMKGRLLKLIAPLL